MCSLKNSVLPGVQKHVLNAESNIVLLLSGVLITPQFHQTKLKKVPSSSYQVHSPGLSREFYSELVSSHHNNIRHSQKILNTKKSPQRTTSQSSLLPNKGIQLFSSRPDSICCLIPISFQLVMFLHNNFCLQ